MALTGACRGLQRLPKLCEKPFLNMRLFLIFVVIKVMCALYILF
jgi:hypothetical protein